ncbi:hypothetical protein WA588_000808 [Blastocystis sp. NMH]
MFSPSTLRIAAVIGIYWITSWSAIFLNKFVYSHLKKGFSASYFTTFLEFVASTTFIWVFSKLNAKRKWVSTFPNINVSLKTIRKVFPLSVMFCMTVTMSNLCLKYVEVSFYQISRSLGIPMIPLINYLIYGEKSTWPTVLSCITVVVGYIAGVDGEVNFSLRGTLFGVGASLVGTFYTISLHHYLANIKMNSWELSFYNNFNSSIIIIVMVLLNGEIPVIWNHRNELSLSFFLWTALAGIVGLFVGITTQLQIKYTSSLSHNISGVAKNCIQTFMGAAIYRTPLTFTGVCGVLLVVGGSFTYTLERIRINSQKEKNPDQESIQLISKEKNQLAEVAVVDES